jgi:NADH-quinone oxidoreductase subunit H
MKFATFFMGEYSFVAAHSALASILFFGGWSGPVLPGAVWFLIKVFAMIFFFMWVRATFPRFRYDQLMDLGWKVLLPIALVNLFLTGVGIVLFQH